MLQELKRQGSVFYDDSEIDGEDTVMSEDEVGVGHEYGHNKLR